MGIEGKQPAITDSTHPQLVVMLTNFLDFKGRWQYGFNYRYQMYLQL